MIGRRQLTAPDGARPALAVGTPAAELAARQRMRMRPHRPMRLLAGALVVVAALAAGLALFSSLGHDTEVLVLTRTVLAGEQLTDADLRVVAVSSDEDVAWVPATERSAVVGQHARYRLPAGGFLTADAVQPGRLVTEGYVLMSVEVPLAEVPVGLREQSDIVLVVTGPGSVSSAPVVLVPAVVAAVPHDLASRIASSGSPGSETVALSVEVPSELVATVGTAGAVSVGVLDGSLAPPDGPIVVTPTTAAPAAATAESTPAAADATTAPTAPSTTTATTAATTTTQGAGG